MARLRVAAPAAPFRPGGPWLKLALAVLAGALLIGTPIAYYSCLIEVPTGQQAVLISKSGLELTPEMEIAPSQKDGGPLYKGVQADVLTEGRYFYNPVFWDWEIRDQFLVPQGKIGVRVALAGDELPAGQVLAEPGQKGILRDVLEPGRYPYNWYAEAIELHDPVAIPAGFRGVVTDLAGPISKVPNAVLVDDGERGVQKSSYAPGTYYLNPYQYHVSLVDMRSQRYDLSEGDPMDFLSADGFSVVIDGNVEFRIIEERLPEVFVLYDEVVNGDEIKEEIITKIIMPESRSICRINGSKLSGGAFISGNERESFEKTLHEELKANCLKQGVEIVSLAISSIQPPQAIAAPIRTREVAKQQMAQYQQEKFQQQSEAKLRVEKLMAEQKKRLVEAEQDVVEKVTLAQQEQAVTKTQAEQELAVAKTKLEAARDQAKALTAKAQADADVIRFKNEAEVAGLSARVAAFNGDGQALAQNILVTKLAPAFRSILSNTDGPIMELFANLAKTSGAGGPPPPPSSPAPAPPAPATAAATTTTTTTPAPFAAIPNVDGEPTKPASISEETKP